MTDWSLIRKLVNTAIDTCENIEKLGVEETDRGVVVNDSITINDFLISSWVAPENLSKKVVCKSHDLGVAKPYTDELSRTMLSIGSLCSELVKLEKIDSKSKQATDQHETSIKDEVEALCNWYERYCLPSIESAIKAKNN
ncbi:hypothetical protein KO527_00730 [Pseudoalteromonas sp. C2R02]|uniref:hypothetical protein n=1 Tax=Pseudoalteromonas sp. C2R02 TaxID=2841565 RepID=UPI001C0915BF|nr:hypothetical protein [Pseudoalteromonas sp. C2R02]MBU2967888.1 hypothetical protein [Pseudoalteromonas sp. C2R02]